LNLLLDTHVALWAITDDERLSAMARDQPIIKILLIASWSRRH
jgi:PIN domain nuclease of toxin-antitoxin system